MFKEAIGILDCGVEGLNILEELTRKFKNENFVYINDLKNSPYFNLPEADSLEFIKANVDRLRKDNIKLLIVANDMIAEIGRDYFNELDIPVFDIISILTEYVQDNFEQKNIVLFGKNSVIEANLYQKNFKYNRLFNIPSDDLEEIICNKGLKTSKSFNVTKEAFKQLLGKAVDVVVTSSPFLIKLNTEIEEFVSVGEFTNFGEIVAKKIYNEFMNLNVKGKGKVKVYSNIEAKKFKYMTYWNPVKYKYIDVDKKVRKLRQKKFEKITK